MIIAKRTRAWFYAFVCTISSVLGGLFGYCIGYFFYNSIGKIILEYYGLTNQFIIFEEYYLKCVLDWDLQDGTIYVVVLQLAHQPIWEFFAFESF